MSSQEIPNLCVVCHKTLTKLQEAQMPLPCVTCKSCGLLYVTENPGIPPEDPRYESYVGRKIR